jgi:hypothetical protein
MSERGLNFYGDFPWARASSCGGRGMASDVLRLNYLRGGQIVDGVISPLWQHRVTYYVV